MDQVITAPRLLISSMYFWTIESNCPKSKDRPVFERYLSIDVCGCLVWKFCRATCKPNQKKKKKNTYIHIEDFFSLFPEVAFHTFFGTPVQYFLRCLGIASKNCRRPRYFHARRHIFQWNTGSRRSILIEFIDFRALVFSIVAQSMSPSVVLFESSPEVKKETGN